MDIYEILKYLHIVAAIIWIGGAAFFNVLGTQVAGARDGVQLAWFGRRIEWLGTRYFTPFSILVLLFGLAMVGESDVWHFSDAWIGIGLAGIVATIVTGAGFLGPTAGRLARAIDAGAPSTDIEALMGRILWVARIDLVVMFLVVADMVFKPGV